MSNFKYALAYLPGAFHKKRKTSLKQTKQQARLATSDWESPICYHFLKRHWLYGSFLKSWVLPFFSELINDWQTINELYFRQRVSNPGWFWLWMKTENNFWNNVSSPKTKQSYFGPILLPEKICTAILLPTSFQGRNYNLCKQRGFLAKALIFCVTKLLCASTAMVFILS